MSRSATDSALSAKKRGLTKKHFLATEASAGVKMAGKLSFPIFIALVAMIVLACFITTNTPVTELPIVRMTLGDEAQEIDEAFEKAADHIEDTDELLDVFEDHFDNKGTRQARTFLKKTQKLVEKPSLSNCINTMKAYEKLLNETDDTAAEILGIEDMVDSVQMITKAFKIVRGAIYGFGVLVILLALWAATGRKTGLAILCILLFVPTCALLSNVLLAVLCFVAFVALAVTTSMVNKAWKKVPAAD